jgi:ABC-type Zn uptake system ZnuABC Zn-binding protein ZnuA
VPLYSDSLGPQGSGAETFVSYMRHNTSAIVGALR